jgi:diguanylate cyclase (GGDEF)-like protein/PAS domain S-box-containing protein
MSPKRTEISTKVGTNRKPAAIALWDAFMQDWAARRLTVEYQPQINLMSKKIVRFEALLRWRHKTLGKIPAAEFIPLAEENGLIGELGEWVLERACADASAWPAEIGVAVNVSATRLHDPALPSIVQNALLQSGLAASRLELEITETAAIVLDAESFQILNSLRALGLRITVDDIDVGHSSFRYLLDFPFDKIKVDASYTALLGQSGRRGEAALAIMQTIAGLCHRLNISCLAEGVETVEQLLMVMGANYTEVQGFLFAQSVAADNVNAVLAGIADRWQQFALPVARSVAAGLTFVQVADVANDVVIITTPDLDLPGPTIVYVNPAFTRLTGYSADEAIGQTPRMLHGQGTSRQTLDAIRAILSEGRAVQEKILNFAKCGAPYWLDMRIEPLRDETGTITHFAAIERDITLDKRRSDELEFVSDRDILTGIPNRGAFLRSLEAEIRSCRQNAKDAASGRSLCVASIEVDRFKTINVSYGYPIGDAVLVAIASRLGENIRRIDTVARLGGEEFAICLPAIALADAQSFADRLRRAISATGIETAAGPVPVTVSIGVAELVPAEDMASLMMRADAALLDAQRIGGDRVWPQEV